MSSYDCEAGVTLDDMESFEDAAVTAQQWLDEPKSEGVIWTVTHKETGEIRNIEVKDGVAVLWQ